HSVRSPTGVNRRVGTNAVTRTVSKPPAAASASRRSPRRQVRPPRSEMLISRSPVLTVHQGVTMSPKITVVVPTIRPERMEQFREDWEPLFAKHNVTLITVFDGEEPRVTVDGSWVHTPTPLTEFILTPLSDLDGVERRTHRIEFGKTG